MSDLETDETNGKRKFEQIAGSPFFTFSRPYLDFIGQGKIFNLVYLVMAGINIILPFVIIYKSIKSRIFNVGAKFVFAVILVWLVIIFACWIGLQLWLDRRKKVTDAASSDFAATSIFSDILQTFGEWLGTLLGIIGAGGGLIASIFLGEESFYLFSAIGMGFMPSGIMVILIGPITGFFIIILSRFLAEQLRLFASLVNNTKEIAANLKNNANGT
jgi:predicted permease